MYKNTDLRTYCILNSEFKRQIEKAMAKYTCESYDLIFTTKEMNWTERKIRRTYEMKDGNVNRVTGHKKIFT